MGNSKSKKGKGKAGDEPQQRGEQGAGADANANANANAVGQQAPQQAGAPAAAQNAQAAAGGAAGNANAGAAVDGPEAQYTVQQIEGLAQVNAGIHQICLGLSPQPGPEVHLADKTYYQFGWPATGQVRVTQFTFQLQGAPGKVDIVRGLAQYLSFTLSWTPLSEAGEGELTPALTNELTAQGLDPASLLFFKCHKMKQHTAANEDEIDLPQVPDKKFIVKKTGEFVKLLNPVELTDFTLKAVLEAQQLNLAENEKESFDRMMQQQKLKVLQSVEEDIKVMWSSFAEMWIHQTTERENNPVYKTASQHAGKACVNLEKRFVAEERDIHERAQKFVDTMFESLGITEAEQKRMHVEIVKTQNSQYYESLFEPDTIRPHLADYRKIAESRVKVGPIEADQMNYHGERWIFHWDDLEAAHDNNYIPAQWQSYVTTGNGVYQRFCTALGLDAPPEEDEKPNEAGSKVEGEKAVEANPE